MKTVHQNSLVVSIPDVYSEVCEHLGQYSET